MMAFHEFLSELVEELSSPFFLSKIAGTDNANNLLIGILQLNLEARPPTISVFSFSPDTASGSASFYQINLTEDLITSHVSYLYVCGFNLLRISV